MKKIATKMYSLYIVFAIIIFFSVCKADSQNETANSQEERSCFSFIRTDESSPINLEETYFEMTNTSVNTVYQGISLYITGLNADKPSSCSLGDIKLETIQKYMHVKSIGARQQRLCRIKMIISINTYTCKDKLTYLSFNCAEGTKSTYFQNCSPVHCPGKLLESEKGQRDKEALILSQLPEPAVSRFGFFAYDIPTSHCNTRQCKLDKCSIDEVKKEQYMISVSIGP
ncbi:uncharacterized protein LOC134248502 [Saccostrea cucullata]|uniref:uncharacterized protein LOC134248502 n=1 Tax=Saccostrea cuccullata TaxID=36930 RepID=UPI002ED3913F